MALTQMSKKKSKVPPTHFSKDAIEVRYAIQYIRN